MQSNLNVSWKIIWKLNAITPHRSSFHRDVILHRRLNLPSNRPNTKTATWKRKKNGTETIKMIQLWYSPLSHERAVWGQTELVVCLLDIDRMSIKESEFRPLLFLCYSIFFSLKIVLKIRVKHGEHNCCFQNSVIKITAGLYYNFFFSPSLRLRCSYFILLVCLCLYFFSLPFFVCAPDGTQ